MERLSRLAAAHGVATSYELAPGRRAQVPKDTVAAVLAALGVDPEGPAPEAPRGGPTPRLLPPTVVHRAGPGGPQPPPPVPAGTVLTVEREDGRAAPWGEPLPPGWHGLHARAPDGRTARATLIACPARLPDPPGGRTHGLMVQLYSLLSARSWGMGDLVDLADLASWAGHTLGAGFVQVNPLHAAVPGARGRPTDPSPYRPGTRRFPDPVHLRVEDIPEYAYLDAAARAEAAPLLERAAALRADVLDKRLPIDRDAVWSLKRRALELVRRVPLSPGRAASYWSFLAEQGQALEDHATWSALAELYGPDWRTWPTGLRNPRSLATARSRADHLERIDFHSWLAWLTDTQLARAQRAARAAGMPIGLVHDLALGVHPHGSDAWAQQDVLAASMSTGAPPDAFNERGQDWGLPPWRPDALAERGYAPYRELLAGLLRHAGALRVDHVMGQFRLWWIPQGAAPNEGTYVRYDAEAMLAVLCLQAHRAGAVVVGEDLGTVEPHVRTDLAERGIVGTSVLWFERDAERRPERSAERPSERRPDRGAPRRAGRSKPHPPHPPLPAARWRSGCLATVTTHDLPPTASRLDASFVRLRARLGLLDPATDPAEAERAALAESAEWLEVFAGLGLLPPGAGEEQRIAAAYRFLARTPARMVGIWLPDALGDRRPQNLPGTTREYPNWRLPLADATGRPVTLEELTASERAASLIRAVRDELARTPGR
ncbi:4-alpha-glucanotransferase [Streptomyces sp. DSM 44917]|uniref:4-alpha-glucanotransferase n=1 Tax=Streptomyces boetiae TaxID=3075541 RepID=A0ABU2L4D7_9ACTN|nr:4-alpha-glucanotransferase [Streptomyces sp. DSM 44917]MDT0306430.1 4-alpha-glucanotransferase [Streptomyces sp. DSM 44917]